MAENKRTPKTLKDLAIALKLGNSNYPIIKYLRDERSEEELENFLKQIKSIFKVEEDRLDIYKELIALQEAFSDSSEKYAKYANDLVKNTKVLAGLIKEELKTKKELKNIDHDINKLLRNRLSLQEHINSLLAAGVRYNQEIFKTAQEMQLQSNITWKEFRELYNESYNAARRMNAEVGKHVHNSKELIKMQNELLREGWKDIDPTTLSNVSASVTLMAKTISGFGGTFPAELLEAFQLSYRQFGSQTDEFITHLGNRLNAFSETFGTSIGMFSGLITQMMSSNSFIARSNMQAQIQANENLMKAAALSGAIGLTSTNFISQLAGVTQFGTASQMASLYQGGALLRDFSVYDFQQQMQNLQYDEAISSLFESIHKTLTGIDDQYLRAEYMERIGSSFGLSREDLLRIMTHGGNLDQYEEDIQEKLLNVNTSMVDELKDFKITLVDQIDNIFANSSINQTLGTLFNEFGLYGIEGHLKKIQGILTAILVKDFISREFKDLIKAFTFKIGGGLGAGGLMSITPEMVGVAQGTNVSGLTGTGAGGARVVALGGMGRVLGGGALAIGGMHLSNRLTASSVNPDISDSSATWRQVGGLLGSIASGAAGGAIIGGGIPGAVIGGTVGLISGIASIQKAEQERRYNLRQAELELRTDRVNRLKETNYGEIYRKTGNAIVDAIYETNADLINVLTDKFTEQIRAQFLIKTMENTSAKITE